MTTPERGRATAEGQKVVKVVPGFGTSSSVPGIDWVRKWYGTLQIAMNYREFFYKAIKAAHGGQEGIAITNDVNIMQARLTGEAYKKAAQRQKKELNCRTFIELTYVSSQFMGETFFCYQRPDGVYIYNTIHQPHERLLLQMIPEYTELDAVGAAQVWFCGSLPYYNPEINFANITNPGDHGIASWAIWDPDVTPEEPIPPEGDDSWQNKSPESVRGKSWGPYYLRKPYLREDTVEPPPVDTSLYSSKNELSPCAI